MMTAGSTPGNRRAGMKKTEGRATEFAGSSSAEDGARRLVEHLSSDVLWSAEFEWHRWLLIFVSHFSRLPPRPSTPRKPLSCLPARTVRLQSRPAISTLLKTTGCQLPAGFLPSTFLCGTWHCHRWHSPAQVPAAGPIWCLWRAPLNGNGVRLRQKNGPAVGKSS